MRFARLRDKIQQHFADRLSSCKFVNGEITLEVSNDNYLSVCEELRDHSDFRFEELMDLCGVDYSTYGQADWETHNSTSSGFERAVDAASLQVTHWDKPRFAAVSHLLSITHNHRVRIRVFAEDEEFPMVHSLNDIWPGVNWFEREAFDLFGITFEGHPDLRRILTDYGFVGHPFRKDFPLIGNVEIRYDASERRCVYEPVSIEPRILVPKVIREDSRKPKGVEDASQALLKKAGAKKAGAKQAEGKS